MVLFLLKIFRTFTSKGFLICDYLPRIAWQLGHLWVTSWKCFLVISLSFLLSSFLLSLFLLPFHLAPSFLLSFHSFWSTSQDLVTWVGVFDLITLAKEVWNKLWFTRLWLNRPLCWIIKNPARGLHWLWVYELWELHKLHPNHNNVQFDTFAKCVKCLKRYVNMEKQEKSCDKCEDTWNCDFLCKLWWDACCFQLHQNLLLSEF